MQLLVQSKLRLNSHEHLPGNLYSRTPPPFARSKVAEPVSDWRVWLSSVSYMAVSIGEVNHGITFEQSAFSKIHESKTLQV